MSKMSDISIELDELGQQLVNYVIQNERDRILRGIQDLENQSHSTKTPIYQETAFKEIRRIINEK